MASKVKVKAGRRTNSSTTKNSKSLIGRIEPVTRSNRNATTVDSKKKSGNAKSKKTSKDLNSISVINGKLVSSDDIGILLRKTAKELSAKENREKKKSNSKDSGSKKKGSLFGDSLTERTIKIEQAQRHKQNSGVLSPQFQEQLKDQIRAQVQASIEAQLKNDFTNRDETRIWGDSFSTAEYIDRERRRSVKKLRAEKAFRGTAGLQARIPTGNRKIKSRKGPSFSNQLVISTEVNTKDKVLMIYNLALGVKQDNLKKILQKLSEISISRVKVSDLPSGSATACVWLTKPSIELLEHFTEIFDGALVDGRTVKVTIASDPSTGNSLKY
ncbi:hypothetical protein Kpol_505p31 [Vanderwaltozyma polyspora DSM 70294]|uniref:RRM domain-containing protein n=1 Tax=Vanderwaltozyma polyspora (strain ATCC 22028 / DSM 70294 / BCRC 21397 / CBS 2163 / NBRC 10782 / NRRL Y-8283 / UCD 57-17) TaxID=436907 RepID=A7TNC2_VANPO|nr:uncharacterized protein Kpol_505p31 [Vanderwaltozyma polyspora DSM 70294]EDO16254.1 hypothetical protein Kpol_505p31 [Vanderwaltozyma polyspora DSM 70294]